MITDEGLEELKAIVADEFEYVADGDKVDITPAGKALIALIEQEQRHRTNKSLSITVKLYPEQEAYLKTLIAENVASIKAEQQRGTPSEEAKRAIETLECIYPSKKEIVTGEYPDVADALDLAITALRQMQGWIPVSEPPKKEDADSKGNVLVWNTVYKCSHTSQYELAGKIGYYSHWSHLPEPPKTKEPPMHIQA